MKIFRLNALVTDTVAKNESSAHLLKSRCGSAIWRLAWWLVNVRVSSTSVAWIWRS